MCTTTGTGEAVMRELVGSNWSPPASTTRRREPDIAGITTRPTSANGTHPIDRVDRVGRTAALTLTGHRPARAASESHAVCHTDLLTLYGVDSAGSHPAGQDGPRSRRTLAGCRGRSAGFF